MTTISSNKRTGHQTTPPHSNGVCIYQLQSFPDVSRGRRHPCQSMSGADSGMSDSTHSIVHYDPDQPFKQCCTMGLKQLCFSILRTQPGFVGGCMDRNCCVGVGLRSKSKGRKGAVGTGVGISGRSNCRGPGRHIERTNPTNPFSSARAPARATGKAHPSALPPA